MAFFSCRKEKEIQTQIQTIFLFFSPCKGKNNRQEDVALNMMHTYASTHV